MDHYCCYCVYVPTTRAKLITKMVEKFPHSCLVSKTSSADMARHAIEDIKDALQNPTPNYPFEFVDEKLQNIRTLQEIIDT